MSAIYNICPLATQYCHACVETTEARVSAVAIYRREYVFANISSAAEWLDLIAAGYALIIPEVRGTYDGGAPVENSGYGRQISRLTNRNHTATWMAPWTCDNTAFYNSLNYTDDWNFVFSNGLYIWDSGAPTNFVTQGGAITENVTDIIEWNTTAKWANPNLPQCYEAPRYIFESCQALQTQINCYTPQPVPLIPCVA